MLLEKIDAQKPSNPEGAKGGTKERRHAADEIFFKGHSPLQKTAKGDVKFRVGFVGRNTQRAPRYSRKIRAKIDFTMSERQIRRRRCFPGASKKKKENECDAEKATPGERGVNTEHLEECWREKKNEEGSKDTTAATRKPFGNTGERKNHWRVPQGDQGSKQETEKVGRNRPRKRESEPP